MLKALLLVDVQNDFMPGGSLPVPEGDQIVPVINKLLQRPFDLIVASKDWHPEGHKSFAATHNKLVGEVIEVEGLKQFLWPIHCIANSKGANFAPTLASEKVNEIIHKGTNISIDSYSAFFDNGHRKATPLEEILRKHNVNTLYIAGLATDYCVKYSALDAKQLGFEVYIIIDACRGVNIHALDSLNALQEMQNAGVHLITSNEITI